MSTTTAQHETEALVIGAGPCGLFQAFELGLLGIDCQIVEALPHAGGQCTELYPDKPIYDIPGIPHTGASTLIEQLSEQLKPFAPAIHYGQTVIRIDPATNKLHVTAESGAQWTAKAVVYAGGVGAFSTVKLKVDGIDQFEGDRLIYGDYSTENLQGKRLVVTGDTAAAVETAIAAAEHAEGVVFVHRTRRLPISGQMQDQLTTLTNSGRITMIKGRITGFHGQLEQLDIRLGAEDTTTVALDLLIAYLGSSPKAGAVSEWGAELARNHIVVNPATFESTVNRLYAVGDINTYAGKRKLILCGFHEATLAAFAIAAQLRDKPVNVQYTTTSTELQKRLGVAPV